MRSAVTSHEVARRAGVSQATVSRVLSGSARVAASTRARVEAIAVELGYQPNAAARAMRSRRTGIVGVVVGRITNPFYPHLLDVLGRMLEERGLQLILWDASHGAGEKAALDALGQRLIDGLLFTTVTSPAPEVAEAIASGAPIVLLNRNLEGVEADLVDSDNVGGSRAVARYLALHERRRVAVVGGPAGTSTANERESGFLRGAADLGLDLPPSRRFDGDFSHESGVAALERSIAAGDLPDAFFCVNDLSALGVLDAARRHGVRVPEDLWVIGFDDIEMAAWPSYDLTTVHQPTGVMAHDAIALLERRLADPGVAPQHHRLAAELIIRGSTGHAPWPRHL